MYEGYTARLKMLRLFIKDAEEDQEEHLCKVLEYNEKKERFTLLVKPNELLSFSLDATYECQIWSDKENFGSQGYIRERYACQRGRVVVFQVQNGFYKKNKNI